MTWSLTVPGRAIPQGSKVVLPRRGGGPPILADDNREKLAPWRHKVTTLAREEWKGHPPLEHPVEVTINAYFLRPKSHYASNGRLSPAGRNYPRPNKPLGDIDKIARAILDSLADGGWFKNDTQVSRLVAEKWWGDSERVLVTMRSAHT